MPETRVLRSNNIDRLYDIGMNALMSKQWSTDHGVQCRPWWKFWMPDFELVLRPLNAKEQALEDEWNKLQEWYDTRTRTKQEYRRRCT